METTRHAATRAQQRAIPPLLLDLLLRFGRSERSGDGTERYFFDKRARRAVQRYAGCLGRLLDQHLDVYAIVSDNDKIVTVGHRLERFHH